MMYVGHVVQDVEDEDADASVREGQGVMTERTHEGGGCGGSDGGDEGNDIQEILGSVGVGEVMMSEYVAWMVWGDANVCCSASTGVPRGGSDVRAV